MKIFVINLEDREDRRKSVAEQLGDVDHELFRAISVHDNPEQYFQKIGKLHFLLETGRRLTRGEIACYASHLLLWKKCVALDEPIVVLEDDFCRTDCFESAMRRAGELIDECGFIRVEPPDKRTIQSKPLISGEFSICRLRRAPFRTTCYAISPATARCFIRQSETFTAPVDHMIRKTWMHKKPLFLLLPSGVELAAIADQTSVDQRRKSLWRHLVFLPRLVYRNWTDRYALIFDRRFANWEPGSGQSQ